MLQRLLVIALLLSLVFLLPCQAGAALIASSGPSAASASSTPSWFATAKVNMFVGLVLVVLVFWYVITTTVRGGKEPYIRPLAGLQAVDEAVGRATEMGKPVLFFAGIEDVDNVQTLAGLSVLSHVARKTAEYDTPLVMPNRFAVVMSTAQEVVKEAHLKAGRPDTFKRENIYYVSDEQFALVAHTDGFMAREKPAANFYMGSFYAESLILAETGHSVGAIQIAGTANAHQLPFFVAACDYTLIGEEFYAASAYLSRDLQQLGSIKGQDICKILIMASILLGVVLETLATQVPALSFLHFFSRLFHVS